MEVNFNNLRLTLQKEFNLLSRLLQEGYNPDDDKFYLNHHTVEKRVHDLRDSIVALMCVYHDGVIDDISEQCSLHELNVTEI